MSPFRRLRSTGMNHHPLTDTHDAKTKGVERVGSDIMEHVQKRGAAPGHQVKSYGRVKPARAAILRRGSVDAIVTTAGQGGRRERHGGTDAPGETRQCDAVARVRRQ